MLKVFIKNVLFELKKGYFMGNDIFNFEEEAVEVEETTEQSESPKDMKKILHALDNRIYSYYDKFGSSEEEKAKNWASESFVAMRWMSAVGVSKVDYAEAKRQGRKKGDKKGAWPATTTDNEYTVYFLLAVNEIVNVKFWDLGSHNKLQWLLMASIGQGPLPKETEHGWIKLPKRTKNKDDSENILLKLYPNANSLELKILEKIYEDKNKLKNLYKSFGYSDEQIKNIFKKK